MPASEVSEQKSTATRISSPTHALAGTLAETLGCTQQEVLDRAVYCLCNIHYVWGVVPGIHVGMPEAPMLDRHWVRDQLVARVAELKDRA